MEDFYRLELSACYRRNYGSGLKAYWGKSALEAVQDCFPQHDWKPWLFTRVPERVLGLAGQSAELHGLAGPASGIPLHGRLVRGYHRDFLRNRGNGLMGTTAFAARAVIDLIPGRNWCEWKFHQVPTGFWEVAENRHRYLRLAGEGTGVSPAGRLVSDSDQGDRAPARRPVAKRYSSFYDLMREFLPQLDWDRLDRHRPITGRGGSGMG